MAFLIPVATAAPYRIANSLRFRAANSAFLSRANVASPTNERVFTYAFWVKRGTITAGAPMAIAGGGNAPAGTDNFGFGDFLNGGGSNDQFQFRDTGIGAYTIRTNARFRDPSAWYHFVVAVNTTLASATDRVRLYVNGAEIASFESSTWPAQNYLFEWNAASKSCAIGRRRPDLAAYGFDGYLADVHLVDGQQLTPSSFGRVDPASGAWSPRRYAGAYGANGFRLPFDDAASTATIGLDRSGNGNNWTTSGISVASGVTFDQTIDTPTGGAAGARPAGNYCTINAIDQHGANYSISNANTRISSGLGWSGYTTGWKMRNGKWYWEIVCSAGAQAWSSVYVATYTAANWPQDLIYRYPHAYAYRSDGQKVNNNAGSAYGDSWTNNDVIGVAFDADNGRVWFSKNGVWQNAGDPAAGTGAAWTGLTGGDFSPAFFVNGDTMDANFGQRPFAHTPPAGFGALCAANLPASPVSRGDDAFEVLRYQGNGSTSNRGIQGARFQGALAWFKDRANAARHTLVDDARGAAFPSLASNTDMNEAVEGEFVSFDSAGVTVKHNPAHAYLNNTSLNCVTWLWRKGAAYGFDIATYAGNGAAGRTVAHGLNAVPHMIFVKCRSGGWTWRVYHRSAAATPQNGCLMLSQTGAFAVSSAIWNDTAPSASSFTVGTDLSVNSNGDSYVAYLWTEIPGFSRFGSYTGNGSTDGPFVWCGFRPRFILIKNVTGATSWSLFDTAINPFNQAGPRLVPNLANAEGADGVLDIVANGFKLRENNANTNGASTNYVFAAFAETPFKFATAR